MKDILTEASYIARMATLSGLVVGGIKAIRVSEGGVFSFIFTDFYQTTLSTSLAFGLYFAIFSYGIMRAKNQGQTNRSLRSILPWIIVVGVLQTLAVAVVACAGSGIWILDIPWKLPQLFAKFLPIALVASVLSSGIMLAIFRSERD